jgi:hypothetical protein
VNRRREVAVLGSVVAVAVAVAAAGCNSARIAGGYTVSPRSAPDGAVVAAYRVGDCRDASARPLPSSHAKVRLVRLIDGSIVLEEARPAYDTIVVDNFRVDKNDRVFELELKGTSTAPYLRQYRVPTSGTDPGQFVIVSDFAEHKTARAFSASYGSADLACDLVPDRS